MSKIVGLTGGIASGKSTVSEMLRSLGALILDADQFSRDATEPGTDCYYRIIDTFGCQVVADDGTISRKALAAAAFSCEKNRLALNAIIHPFVLSLLKDKTRQGMQNDVHMIVWDVPLLLEVGWQKHVDCVVMVAADENTRVRRIAKRDGIPQEQALIRIRTQMTDADKARYANFVLMNQSGTDRLRQRVEEVYARICSTEHEGEWYLH